MLSKDQYEEFFGGYDIEDAVVQNASQFYFVLTNKKSSRKGGRVVRIEFLEDGLDITSKKISGFDRDDIFCDMTYPDDAVLVIDCNGRCFHSANGSHPPIPYRSIGGPFIGTVKRIKPIGVSPAMVVTSVGELIVHQKDETWTRHGPEIADDHPAASGFDDFDGFGVDDIYAGGEDGLFHFDGSSWEKTAQPKRLVSAVCCAPDGDVYAATWMPGRVAIYKGRGETWEKLYEDRDKERYANPYKNLVWHDGMLWGASWSEMIALKDGKKEYWRGGPSGGNLSARDGVLLCAGDGSAYWRKEGGPWHTLFERWAWRDA